MCVESSEPRVSARRLLDLPCEILALILRPVPPAGRKALRAACRRWRALIDARVRHAVWDGVYRGELAGREGLAVLRAVPWRLDSLAIVHAGLPSARGLSRLLTPALLTLDLSGNPMGRWIAVLADSHLPRLQRLLLSACGIDARALVHLVTARWPALRHLGLGQNRIGYAVGMLAQLHAPALERLDLCDNDIRELRLLEHARLPQLRVLRLSLNPLHEVVVPPGAPRLRSLLLSGCQRLRQPPPGAAPPGVCLLSLDRCSSLVRLPGVQFLSLRALPAAADMSAALTEGLVALNLSGTRLWMGDGRVWPNGTPWRGLPRLPRLQVLCASGCRLGCQWDAAAGLPLVPGIMALLRSDLPALRVLDVTGNGALAASTADRAFAREPLLLPALRDLRVGWDPEPCGIPAAAAAARHAAGAAEVVVCGRAIEPREYLLSD